MLQMTEDRSIIACYKYQRMAYQNHLLLIFLLPFLLDGIESKKHGNEDVDSYGSGIRSEDDFSEGSADDISPTSLCHRQQIEASARNQPEEQHIPQCTAAGEFVPRQCQAAISKCWCVNHHGHELPGTRHNMTAEIPCLDFELTKTQCPASTVFQFSLICVQCTPSEISSNLIPRDVVLRYGDVDRCFCVRPDKSGMTSTASGFITRQSAKVYVRLSTTTSVAVANPKLDDVILIENKDIVEPDNKLNQIPSENEIDIGLANPDTNEIEQNVNMLERKEQALVDSYRSSVISRPGLLAGIIGGATLGLLVAVLLVMFIVYRMRKRDEGSYALDEPKGSPAVGYTKSNDREYFA